MLHAVFTILHFIWPHQNCHGYLSTGIFQRGCIAMAAMKLHQTFDCRASTLSISACRLQGPVAVWHVSLAKRAHAGCMSLLGNKAE
jgi:hypothetical protein